MTRNLDDATRCDKCNGLIRAGKPCKRCASADARMVAEAQREQRSELDRDRASQESAAASSAKRNHLANYVREYLAQDGYVARCEWTERNPMEKW